MSIPEQNSLDSAAISYLNLIDRVTLTGDLANHIQLCNEMHLYFSKGFPDVSVLESEMLPFGWEVLWQAGHPPIIGEQLGVRNAEYTNSVRWERNENKAIVIVPEGHILKFPRGTKLTPYAFMDMSTCSGIIGVDSDHIWVAHIRDSETTALKTTIEYLQALPNNPELFAIASLGVHSEYPGDFAQVANGYNYAKVTSIDSYIEAGIQPDKIRTFEMKRVFTTKHRTTDFNRVGVIVGPNLILSYNWDLTNDLSATNLNPVFSAPREIKIFNI